jgi:hypothetical protein
MFEKMIPPIQSYQYNAELWMANRFFKLQLIFSFEVVVYVYKIRPEKLRGAVMPHASASSASKCSMQPDPNPEIHFTPSP